MYDKTDDFDFEIVNFPFVDNKFIPSPLRECFIFRENKTLTIVFEFTAA